MKTTVLWLASALVVALTDANAQAPNEEWRTMRTPHFRVHFTKELEEIARRAAASAESSYVKLSRHLKPARGTIDLVVADNQDFANGAATPLPSNRIVIFANPPVFASALRFTDDPIDIVVLHELTHIFHLDRAGGIWKPLQLVMGRVPFFFPNAYQPSWLVEGLAVYYESLLTGSGRIEGSEHRMIARSAALDHALPRLDRLSLASPHFPYGTSAYAYGSLFIDHLARTYGDSAIRTYVESNSRQLIPLLLDFPARRAFRSSFGAAFRRWTDSLSRAAPPAQPPMPGWIDLTVDGAYANFPRWLNDSSLVYTGTPGDESYGAYKLTVQTPSAARPTPNTERQTPNAKRERIGRRHSRSPNTVLSDGSLLYSQLEYVSPYHVRSDLYVDRARGGTDRLTYGARLAFPDARADGLIVATQTLPGIVRLALVSPNGREISPLTSGSLDEHWTEPRWSPDGAHIAAARWLRGGTSEIVVVDTAGRIVATLARDRAVNATPSWSRDGRFVYFSSDRDGTPNLYRAAFAPSGDATQVAAAQRLSDAQTGLFEPQPSPSDSLLAAVVFKSDGYHVGVAPIASDAQRQTPDAQRQTRIIRELPAAPSHESRVTKYSPWRSLLPTWYLPLIGESLEEGGARIGAYTSGVDIVGRHSYDAELLVPTDNTGLTGYFYHRYAGFKQPLVETFVTQEWENFRRILDAGQQNQPIGMLRRRIREAFSSLTYLRTRARSNAFASVGAGVEARDYRVDSLPLLDRIDSLYRRAYYYPRISLSLGWSNAQFPPLSISPEDGISLATTVRQRWRNGAAAGEGTTSIVGSTSLYKSLDLPGYAHHVVALRGAGGLQDNRGTSYFEVGGVSGGTLEVVPGYVLGEGRRTFGVRGFPGASLLGMYALTGSAEYRVPFLVPGRGLGTLPLFLDRTSVTLFGDAGAAWCPGVFALRPAPSTSLCTRSDLDNGFVLDEPRPIGSVGAELNASLAILNWDHPFRWRAGVAVPVTGMALVPGVKSASVYLAVGASF